MRIYTYTISGIVLALLAWSLSQLLIIDLVRILGQSTLPFRPDFILLPIVGACLAAAMVVTEIFSSNPTRYKANRRRLPPYLTTALGTGALAGLVAAVLTWGLYRTGAPSWSIRVVAWSLIGLFVGLGEAVSWRFRSLEGATSKANARIGKATLFGLGAGLTAAVLVEIFRNVVELGGYEDPLGLMILGLALGLFLSFAAAPTFLVALRAGEGFEAIDPDYDTRGEEQRPKITHPDLKFFIIFDQEEEDFIEEGYSIQLPPLTKKPLLIGSSEDADIYLPHTPAKAAALTVNKRDVKIRCLAEKAVQIQRKRLLRGGRPKTLSHNQILTFYHEGSDDKYYRFIFYDRFLDPQA